MTRTYRLGIDIGGTFTDLLLYEERDGAARVRLAKIPTSVDNRAAAVLAAIDATGIAAADLDLIIHGTTATATQQGEAIVERIENSGHSERCCAGSRQLDRKGNPVETAADRLDRPVLDHGHLGASGQVTSMFLGTKTQNACDRTLVVKRYQGY